MDKNVGRGDDGNHFTKFDVSKFLVEGRNSIAVKVINRDTGSAGLAGRVTENNGRQTLLVTNGTWKTYTSTIPKWQQNRFADTRWKQAKETGPRGVTNPWVVEALPSAQQVAAINSTAKPKRVPWED